MVAPPQGYEQPKGPPEKISMNSLIDELRELLAGLQEHQDQYWHLAADNFLRQYGPALLQAVEEAEHG